MALGPGRYDPLCTVVRTMAGAETAIVVIIKGNLGSGFSVQSEDPQVELNLPRLLRVVADEIEGRR